MEIKVINKSAFSLPNYVTQGSAGMDIKANISSAVSLAPMERCLIPTGLFFEIPQGYECQIRPRSGLALKKGIGVLNSPGTIDSDYRGEVGVILINLSVKKFEIQPGERIAQMVFCPIIQIKWAETTILDASARGAGGFGSTGNK